MSKRACFLLSVILFAGSLSAAVTVTSPGADAVWTIGGQGMVRWTWSEIPDAQDLRVRILLRKGDENFCTIAEGLPLVQGQFLWTAVGAGCPGLVAGSYRVRVRVINVGGFDSAEFKIAEAGSIRVPPDLKDSPLPPTSFLLPDLAVTGHSYDPAHPKVDDLVTFRATITNLGKGTTVPVTVIADVSGPEGFRPFSKSFRLPPLSDAPGSNANEIHFTLVATHMGIVRIQLRLDSGREQAEKDEDNNVREFLQGIEPKPLPDLIVCTCSNEDVQMTTGRLELIMVVKNVGHARSAPCSLRVWLEDVKGHNVKWRNVPSLFPGQRVMFTADCVWLTNGTKNVHFHVDSNGSVDEENEDNNKVTAKVYVWAFGEPVDGYIHCRIKCSDGRILGEWNSI